MGKSINIISILGIFVFSIFSTFGQDLSDQARENISEIIQLVKNNKKSELATKVNYPLERKYPLPDIESENEFIKRYDQIFDKQLVKKITSSDIEEDWSDMGWRGIMLSNGLVWLSSNGENLKAINYQSKFEKSRRKKIIDSIRENIHPSLSKFKNPVLVWKTENYEIRIDHLGNNKYRYASWSKEQKQSEKPKLTIKGGKKVIDGNGGNHKYVFKNGNYKYECYVSLIGKVNSPPGELTVYKNGKKLLHEDVKVSER